MSFAFPWGLLALTALAPLTAAYFLRRRQKPLTVSALFLWRTPHQKAEAGPRFEKYSRELSFLLELLAVLAATAYLADLRFGSDVPQRHVVVVLDGSLSMSARPPEGPALAERVRTFVAKTASQEHATQLTVVESGVSWRLLAGPRAKVSEALSLLEAWRPMGGAHDPWPAFSLARELAGPKEAVWYFTDALPPADRAVPDEVTWTALGQPLDNLAFVAAQRTEDGAQSTVTVRVANFSTTARRVTVSFTAAGVRQQQTVELEAGGTVPVRAVFKGAGEIAASLPDDALPADGLVTLLPAPPQEVPYQLLDGLSPAATSAIERFAHVTPGLQAGPGGLTLGGPGSRAVVSLGASGKARTFVGPFFIEKSDPLLEDVDLAGVVWTAGENPPGRALVTANDVALVTEEPEGALHLNVDLARSSLARTQAWPVLLSNLVRRARFSLPGFPQHQLPLGASVPVVVGSGAVFSLSGPAGTSTVLGRGLVTLPPPRAPGRYLLSADGKPSDTLEVMAIDAAESDLRARSSGTVAAKTRGRLLAAGFGQGRASWPLLVLLLLVAGDFILTRNRVFS